MGIKQRADELRSTADQRFGDLRKRWPPVEFAVEGLRRWVDANGTILAGHLAFRVFSFLVPLYLVAIALLGFLHDSGTNVGEAAQDLHLGSGMAGALAEAASDANETKFQALLVGLFALAVAGAGLASALRSVYGVIWNVKPSKSALGRLAIVGTLIIVVLVQVVGSALRLVLDGPAGFGLGVLIVSLLGFGAVLLVSWVLPRRATQVLDLLIGSVVGGVAFAGLNIASAVYFTDKLQRSSEVYGSLGIAVTVLLYLFVVGQILVVSAICNTLWVDRAHVMAQARGEEPSERAVGEL
ncbi:MAG: YhjD/YihY/BrkB family envelope integrity protein [Acidimicrobiales bacterium]|nr:YihY/virulence factor BrkB family protein [Acidimicrobiales bacterium]